MSGSQLHRFIPKHVPISSPGIHIVPFKWRHNERDGVWNHQPHDCLFNRLSRRRSKRIPMLHVTGLCAGNSPVTDEFPAQKASYTESVSIWWRHHVLVIFRLQHQRERSIAVPGSVFGTTTIKAMLTSDLLRIDFYHHAAAPVPSQSICVLL